MKDKMVRALTIIENEGNIFTKGDEGNRSILELPFRTKASTEIFFKIQFFMVATPSIDVAPVIANVMLQTTPF